MGLRIIVVLISQLRGVPVPTEEHGLAWILFSLVYWGSWVWFHELRKLPSAQIAIADKVTVVIFLVTSPLALAVSLGGPDAVKQWEWVVPSIILTLLVYAVLVVLAMKGPAWVRAQEKDIVVPRGIPVLRAFAEPSVIIAMLLGFYAVDLAFESLVPSWLERWTGAIYGLAVFLLIWLLVSTQRSPADREAPEARDEVSKT